MKGIDYKDFKKVSSDKKSTVLRHSKGHELKIAHNALSSNHKAALDKLPVMMAEGGETDNSVSTKEAAPVQIYVGGQPAAPQAQQPVVEQAQSNREEQAAEAQAQSAHKFGMPPAMVKGINQYPVPEAQKTLAPQAPVPQQTLAPARGPSATPAQPVPEQPMAAAESAIEPAPAAAPEQSEYQKSYADYKQEHQTEFAQQDAAFNQDLTNGHIQPKTYHDLFAKKDTLGKIGAIFGLMVSGAGAGLTHQPNAVLQMMDNQIKQDLEAQMKSKDNAQNFLKINQQQQVNMAQIEQLKHVGKLTDAQAQAEITKANLNAFTLSQLQANRAALHNQTQMVAKMPEGPMKEQAKQALAMMGTAVTNENANLADIASSKMALMSQLGMGGSGDTTALRMMGMKDLAENIEHKTIPGVGRATRDVPEAKRAEIQAMDTLDYKVKDILKFAKENKGSLNPNVLSKGAQKAEELINFYNQSIEGGALTEGRLGWFKEQIKKNPTSIFQDILGNNAKLKEIMESNASRRDIALKGLGIKTPEHKDQHQQAMEWAAKNPDDPRAKRILQLNGRE